VKPTVLLSEMSKENSWNNHLVLWDPGVTPNAADKFAHLVSEEDRQRIFTSFWSSMDWNQRKIYVVGLADMVDVTRKRTAFCEVPPEKRRNQISSVQKHVLNPFMSGREDGSKLAKDGRGWFDFSEGSLYVSNESLKR